MGKQQIEGVIKIPVLNANRVLKEYFSRWPNILSVDTEGVDLEILRAIDWKAFRIEIVCVEVGNQKDEIIKLMAGAGYRILGDNCLNVIFGR